MEGPSLHLAAEQLRPFIKKTILEVSGNTKLDKERLAGKKIRDIFAWGKHLVFQFDDVAVRFHFLLFGTFTATIDEKSVTGDYDKTGTPRLAFVLPNGVFNTYTCSVKFFEEKNYKSNYDFSIDIMAPEWDEAKALKSIKSQPDAEIADVLLDQEIFAGVGNIIKNEVLAIRKISPLTKINALSTPALKALIKETQGFSQQFYEWRKEFKLRANLHAHGKKKCQYCGRELIREKTGKRQRWSYYCTACQPVAV